MNSWVEDLVSTLEPAFSAAEGQSTVESCALSVLACHSFGRSDAARSGADWLTDVQQPDGSVSLWGDQSFPKWPTSLAMLAWLSCNELHQYSSSIRRAVAWTLANESEPVVSDGVMGHDTQLIGWSWVTGTHGWIEPSALFVCALRQLGFGEHPRVHEAILLLLDRQLPAGGCNYGNTTVLGQTLRPHVQPTGIAMLALAQKSDPRITRTLDYLERILPDVDSIPSLAWSLLGLAAHGRHPGRAQANNMLYRIWNMPSPLPRTPLDIALVALSSNGVFSRVVQDFSDMARA
ncbi:MAG: hypothetical protein KDB03_08780 [Planctomycetales bacterium]|nr:hypothetical protein [Planctomycetales bacterium]